MGYVAVKGGEDAIAGAAQLVEYYRRRHNTDPLTYTQIGAQLRSLVDKIMGEGGLYAPEHAALALKQVEGDVFEAAFIVRAYRTTLERRYVSVTLDTREMLVRRRISSAFREIPGGQMLGPTRDYTQRLLNPKLANETHDEVETFLKSFGYSDAAAKLNGPATFTKVIDLLTSEGILKATESTPEQRAVVDVTREPLRFPAPRSAVLQSLARAETGCLMGLAYSAMRGFGNDHSAVGELRVGDVPVRLADRRGRVRYVGRVQVTEAEMVGGVRKSKGKPHMSMGYGLCFGQNETKAISMGILDNSLREPGNAPAQNQEFVLYHTECVEAYGFTNHLKLPHYVTFQSGLDNVRHALKKKSPVASSVAVKGDADGL